MATKYNNDEFLETDSIFTTDPKEYYNYLDRSAMRRHIKVFYTVITIYEFALASMYWFIWQPAVFKNGKAAFYHSPTFFFAIVWVVITAIPIFLSLQGMRKYGSIRRRIINQSSKIARETQYLENSIANDNKYFK